MAQFLIAMGWLRGYRKHLRETGKPPFTTPNRPR